MTDVTVQMIADLSNEGENLRALGGIKLAATSYIATARTWPTDYRGLVDGCCTAARPVTEALFAEGYSVWLVLIGAALDAGRRSRLRNYALANPAIKDNLIEDVAMERVFHLTNAERTAGLYLMNAHKFRDGCQFLTHNLWAQIILSRRDEFLSEANLGLIYQSSVTDDNGISNPQINWQGLSVAVCPLGDIVVKTYGAFDDRWREIRFVYSPNKATMAGN